ncbi:glutathione synthetase [Apiospora arundinis]
MEATHKQEYRIRELETRSVTLFTGRAQIFRQLKDVPLKAGENQITIVGLTPTVDKDSIKVEGTGSAIITDIAVELLPNREIFEDVYPEYDEDDSDDSDPDSDIEQKKEDSEKEEMVQLREKIRTAEDEGRAPRRPSTAQTTASGS